MLAYCERAGIAFVPWLPLSDGRVDAAVGKVAADAGVTPMQVVLAWLLRRSPVMLPIPGTGSLSHLEENAAAGAVELTAEQYERLDALGPPN